MEKGATLLGTRGRASVSTQEGPVFEKGKENGSELLKVGRGEFGTGEYKGGACASNRENELPAVKRELGNSRRSDASEEKPEFEKKIGKDACKQRR